MTEVSEDPRALLRARLAAAREALANPDAPASPSTQDTSVRLSAVQRRLWFLAQRDPDSAAYHVPLAFRLTGALDEPALLGALRKLAARHRVLRGIIDGDRVRFGSAEEVSLRVVEIHEAELAKALELEAARPFVLTEAPPMRATLFQVDSGFRVLALTIHHIATDGWSERILLSDLAALYRGATLPPAPQYADVVADGAADPAGLAWWETNLAGLAPLLEVPTDRPRILSSDWPGAAVPAVVPPDLAGGVRALAAGSGATPFMVMLAAWQALLGRLAGTDDVAVGVPHAGRYTAAQDKAVGCFLDAVVVRTDLAGEPSGHELINRVRGAALDAIGHASVPFEEVVRRLAPERIASATPIYQAMLNVYDEVGDLALPGVRVERILVPPPHAKLDLSLELAAGTGFEGRLEYRADLFEPRTAERLVGWFLALLSGMVDDPARAVGTIPLEPGTGPVFASAPVETGFTPVHERFERWAAGRPDAVAVVAADGELSYGELDRRANRLAHKLIALGVRPGEPVGILLDPDTRFPVALLGILKAGGAYLPIDTMYPTARVWEMLRIAGAWHLVEDLAGDEWPDHRPGLTVDPEDLAHVIFTSGSTGVPNGVEVEHGTLAHRAADLPAAGSFALASTVAADIALTSIFGALLSGGTLHLLDRETATDPGAFAARMRSVDAVKLTPSHLNLLARHGNLVTVLPRRLLMLGGEAVPWSLVEDVRRARPDLAIHVHYGQTELTMLSLVCDVDEVPAEQRTDLVPLGRPRPGVLGAVVDRAGNPLPAGMPGELVLGGPGLARGYAGAPELTAFRFIVDATGERWYRTGDRVRIREHVEFLGRVDDQVKLRGYRVEPGEVAAVVRSLPGVTDAVVLPEGDGLIAWVVGDPPADKVRARLRELLPGYLVPAEIVVLEQLPLGPNGKVDRSALPRPTGRDGFDPPTTVTEVVLAGVWEEILGVPRVGARDDFFALGGHSFAATRMVGRLAEVTGCAVPVRVVFERPVLADLAAEVDRRQGSESGIPRRAEQGGPVRLSPAQERLWLLWRLRPDGDDYNTSVALRLSGPLDVDVLREAIRALAARHEVLCTVVADREGGPVAVPVPPERVPVSIVDYDAEALRVETVRPFDLEAEPPMRALVLRVSDTEHVLALTVHHIAVDAWSWTTILGDLAALCAGNALASLPIQYADVAEWERGEPVEDEHLDWWVGRLRELPSLLELPTDRARGPETGWAGAEEPVVLPAELVARIRGVEGCTPFMVLLAGWQALLAQLAGTEDVAVGVPVSGRHRPGTGSMVGCFVNTVVLRGDLSNDPTVGEALRRTRAAVLDAFAHSDVPFERIVDRLQPARDLDSTPLFQTMLNVVDLPPVPDRFADLAAEELPTPRTRAQFDLALTLFNDGTTLVGSLNYRSGLFDQETIQRWTRWFVELLNKVTTDEGLLILGIDPLSEAERAPLTGPPLPERRPATVVAAVLSQARRRPNAPAIVDATPNQAHRHPTQPTLVDPAPLQTHRHPTQPTLVDPAPDQAHRRPTEPIVLDAGPAPSQSDQPQHPPNAGIPEAARGVLTYGELVDASGRVASGLLARGVRPGDVVGVRLPRDRMLAVALLGVLRAGAAYLPLDPDDPPARIAEITADAGAWLVVDSLDELLLHSGPSALEPRPSDVAYVLYTSGSTGRPKGVPVTHGNLAAFVAAMLAEPGMTPEDVTLGVVPYTFDVFGYELWVTLAAGARLAIADRETTMDGHALAEWIDDMRVTTATATPTTLRMLVAAGWRGRPLRMISIGEVLDPALAADLRKRVGELWNAYGPTETTIYSTIVEVGDGPVTIGGPLAGEQVHVMDRWGRPALPGSVGELLISGAGVALGYLNRPELTAERFVTSSDGERCYRTGDLVRRRGNELEYLGRTDNQVKVRGHRIELGEIEAVLRSHPEVADAVVTVAGAAGEHHLVGYLVPRTPGKPAVEPYLRERLPGYLVPHRWVVLESFPTTANGKIDRRALPEPDAAQRITVPPSSLMERLVAGIWAEVLGVDGIGVRDDFFALGGHSLAATRVVARLRAALGWAVPVRALFDHPVLGDLAEDLERVTRAHEPVVIPRRTNGSEPVPLTPAQARMWFLTQLDQDRSAYHVRLLLRLRGALDGEALLGAVRDLAERHEVLRCRIVEHDGIPVAVVEAADIVPAHIRDVPPDVLDAVIAEETERPFVLSDGPPMRAALLCTGGEAVLALTFHHIAVDDLSMARVRRELAALYAARLGPADPLPPADQHTDFAAWLATQPDHGDLLDWWHSRLSGLAPVLELPTDRPRQAVAGAEGGEIPLCVNDLLTARVREAAARIGGTPFMVLLAAWQALLGRLCRSTDVPVGVAESGRHHPGTEAMIGCFINTVVMRTDLAGDPTGAELLTRVREVAVDAFAHAEAPFEQVVDRLAPERNLTATPVVQALINVLGPEADPPGFPGLHVELLERPQPAAKSDLGLTLAPNGNGYAGALSYRRDLFDPATAERIAAWYVAQLSGMLADLDRPANAVPLDSHTGPVLVGPPRPVAEDTLHTRVERWVDRTPHAVAVVGPDGQLTYAELDRLANRIAHALLDKGVGPDEPVGVLFEPSTRLAAAMLGVLKAGAGYLPLDASYPAERVRSILDKAGARVLLTVNEFAAGGAGRSVLALDDRATLTWQPDYRPRIEVRADHLLHVIFTSGSTGVPKGIAVEHRSMLDYMDGMLVELGDTAGGSFAVVSTIAADLGHICLHGALLTGGVVHLVAREVATDPAALASYFAEHPVDVLKLVPSHMELLATNDDLAAVLPRRLLLMAGESLAWSLVDRIEAARPGLRVQSHYGPTETTAIRMVCELGDIPAERRTGIVPLGRMLPNAVGWLVDAAGRPVPPGVPGELLIGGPGVARGYLGEPELTARAFVEHEGHRVYKTGDLLRIRPDGAVEFKGRVDDQIKVRGYRVEPGEVATTLRSLPGVAEAVVLPVGDGHRRRLAAWLVPSPGQVLDPGELRGRLRERLPDYLVPANLTVLDRLPLNPNGKVDRAALPTPRPEQRTTIAPRTPTEHRLAAVWQEILGVAEVGIDDDFFTLGGDSFAAVRAVRAADPTLRVIDLFTRPTVRQLASYVDEAAGSGRLLHRLRAGTGATVICVPYGGGSAAVFRPLAEALPNLTVLAAELPGHDPARPDEPLIPLPELVDRLALEISETVTGPIVLYGHCVGSAVAVALARRLEADGRAVLGVIVGGSFPSARLPGRLSGLANRVLPLQRWASNRLYRDILRATGGLLDDMDEAATEAALRGMRHDSTQSRAWFSAELAGPRTRLTAPLLCVVGERDRATELYGERYTEWGEFAERVELATIPHAGHYFLRHQAAELAALIAGRVRDWSAGRLPAVLRAERPTGLRAFYAVAGGQFVSMLGNALSVFALEVWAYQRSGRVFDLALVILLATLPAVLATPLGGALADRVDRRRIMLGADLASGVAMAMLAVLLAVGGLTLPAVCVIVTITSTAMAFHQPAYLAAIAQLVPKPYLPQANAFSQLGLGVGTVLGPVAGGALLALTGLPGVIVVDVCSFGIAVGTLLLVRFPNRLWHRQEEPFRRAITGGWRFIAARRPLLLMIGFAAVLNCLAAMALVAITPLVLSFAGVPALGLVTTIGGLGAALGGILMFPWGGTRRRMLGMIGATIGIGAGTVLMGLHASVLAVALGLAIRMAALAIMNAHWLSIIQVKVGQELQGRVLATNLMLALATQPIGFLAAAPLAGALSPDPGRGMALVMLTTGLGIIAWALIALLTRPLRTLEDTLPDATPTAEIPDDLDAVQASLTAAAR